MNGIIHNCTHGNDPGTKFTEEEMVVKIFTYLDKLFQVVKPQRLLFMAIDGKRGPCRLRASSPLLFWPNLRCGLHQIVAAWDVILTMDMEYCYAYNTSRKSACALQVWPLVQK